MLIARTDRPALPPPLRKGRPGGVKPEAPLPSREARRRTSAARGVFGPSRRSTLRNPRLQFHPRRSTSTSAKTALLSRCCKLESARRSGRWWQGQIVAGCVWPGGRRRPQWRTTKNRGRYERGPRADLLLANRAVVSRPSGPSLDTRAIRRQRNACRLSLDTSRVSRRSDPATPPRRGEELEFRLQPVRQHSGSVA